MNRSRFILDCQTTAETLDDYTCLVCRKIVVSPKMCRLNHLFCAPCIRQHLRTSDECPGREKHSVAENEIFPNIIAERSLGRLRVRCENLDVHISSVVRRRARPSTGCEWVGPLKEQNHHLEACLYRRKQCSLCNRFIPRLVFDGHFSNCRQRQCCEMCGITVDDSHSHSEVCEMMFLPCPNHCYARGTRSNDVLFVQRRNLNAHLKECPKHHISCPLKALGCDVEGTRAIVESHMRDEIQKHMVLCAGVAEEVKSLRALCNSLQLSVDKLVAREEERESSFTPTRLNGTHSRGSDSPVRSLTRSHRQVTEGQNPGPGISESTPKRRRDS